MTKIEQRRDSVMKKTLSKLAVKVLNKSLRTEADSACALLGYQPRMPEAVKKFKKEKK